jgi:tripartite-type tricarboxylate transporter receptor subunit TctC
LSMKRDMAAAVASSARVSLLCGFVLAFVPTCLNAQTYPTRPLRMVVPFPPGGGTDVIGRLIAQKLTAALGQQVIVDNRIGAAGRLGTEYVAHAMPDGYTLLMTTTTTIITAPALFAKLAYQSPKDFAPIGPIVTGAMVLVVHPSVPARSVKALIALAKQHPGQLNFASTGPGDTNHLAAELFQIRAGVQMVHVPYKGAAPATLSVVMGETGLMFSNIVPVMPPLEAGKVVPLGITSLARSPMLPQVWPIAEQGLPGYEVENLYALLAPRGTPADVVRRLSDELRKVVQAPELKERLQADGSRVITSTPDELEKTIITEIAKWTKVIKAAGIKAEY